METPVKFLNRKGDNLFGMLFCPEPSQTAKVMILMCVSSIKHRIGPSRLYTLLARALCQAGYHVMCFDPAGIGDSEGALDEKSLTEHHLDIQHGKFREDIEDAVGFCLNHAPTDRLILCGLCGGAISAIIAGAGDDRVDSLILLAVPVLLDRVGKHERSQEHAACGIKHRADETPTVIRKAITLISLVKVRWKLRASGLTRTLSALRAKCTMLLPSHRGERSGGHVRASSHPRFNHLFLHSFFRFTRGGRKILFVLPEYDLASWMFRSEFQQKVLSEEEDAYRSTVDVCTIEGAQHSFAGQTIQLKLFEAITAWLTRHHPVR